MMDITQINPIQGIGAGAPSAVASAMAPRRTATQATAKDASTSGSSASSATDPSDITSDDFLTLLVSELKNQDPTQPTDPNAYIQQLVGVNSLQQLIQINQGLTTLESPVTSNSTSNAVSGTASS